MMDGEHALASSAGTAWRRRQRRLRVFCRFIFWSTKMLSLCNCDCKVITCAVCVGLQEYSIECIRLSQRCVTQRIMTDNIFEIETAAIALRTCYADDPGILFSLTSLVPFPVWTTD